MNIEERVEKAAKAIYEWVHPAASSWDKEGPTVRGDYTEAGRAVIAKVFPELLDGTGWIAPWEATEAMANAGCRSAIDDLEPTNPEMEIFYRAMRDAHLASSAKSGEE